MTDIIYNETLYYMNGSLVEQAPTTQTHLFSVWQIILVIALFSFLAYWYVKVTKNKEKYVNWTNPNGNTINLYKKIRLIFWLYVATIITTAIILILTVPTS